MRPRYCLHALLVAIFTSWGCLDAQDTGIAPVPPPRNAISADRMAQEYFENRRNQDAITMLLFGGVLSLVGIGFPTYMFILAGRKRVDRKFHNCIKKRIREYDEQWQGRMKEAFKSIKAVKVMKDVDWQEMERIMPKLYPIYLKCWEEAGLAGEILRKPRAFIQKPRGYHKRVMEAIRDWKEREEGHHDTHEVDPEGFDDENRAQPAPKPQAPPERAREPAPEVNSGAPARPQGGVVTERIIIPGSGQEVKPIRRPQDLSEPGDTPAQGPDTPSSSSSTTTKKRKRPKANGTGNAPDGPTSDGPTSGSTGDARVPAPGVDPLPQSPTGRRKTRSSKGHSSNNRVPGDRVNFSIQESILGPTSRAMDGVENTWNGITEQARPLINGAGQLMQEVGQEIPRSMSRYFGPGSYAGPGPGVGQGVFRLGPR